MAIIALSRDEAIANDGHVYYKPNSASEFEEMTGTTFTPPGISGARTRPVIVKYKGKSLIYGMFNTPIIITKSRKMAIQGIPSPANGPTLGFGASSGGSDGIGIGYLTFLEKDGGTVVHESNPSAPSDSLEVTGQGFVWTNIPATSSNPRVTHVRGYRSMDGSIPGVAWERTLGVTTVSENVPTGQLGERLPLFEGADNEFDVDPYARCVPPNCRFAEVYFDAIFLSGDMDHPERIYFSRLFEPESFNTVIKERGWLETTDGSAVTGLKRHGDVLIVTSLRGIHAVQGFSARDYQIIKINNYYGCISHHSLQLVGPDSDLWGAGQEGVWAFNGSFHDLMKDDLRNEWRDDYRANQTRYEDCFGAEDRFTRTYHLVIPQQDGTTFKYVGHWEPFVDRGQPPWWVTDRRNRRDNAIGSLIVADADHYGELLTGSCDGFIRKENVEDDADDDGDTYQKALTIRTKHFFFGDQGGDYAHGRNYPALDIFLQNEDNAVTLSAYAGDDTAGDAATPQWSRTIAAGAVSTPRAKVPRTSLSFNGLTEINGKGITLKFTASSPVGVKLRGYTIYHSVGEQERPFSS